MKEVICKNDKNLPEGAFVQVDKIYEVENEYINALDQRVYIIRGVPNEGITKLGMRWIGYRADRFSTLSDSSMEIEEKSENFAYN